MSLGSVRLASMGPRVGWVTLALFLEVALPAMLVALASHPTTLALVGRGAGRVRSEGEALRRRHAERSSREAATASLIDRPERDRASGADEAWAEASEPEETGDADADEAGAEDLEAVADAGEADEQDAERPEETGETAAEEAVDSDAGRVEGDAVDPAGR